MEDYKHKEVQSMDARELINETVIGKKKKKKGSKNPARVKAAKANWKANRSKIVAGIRKFWKSAEGKALAKKLAAYRARKESFEYEADNLVTFAEEEAPEIVNDLKAYIENDLEGLENLMYTAEVMEDDMTFTEATIKARKKRRIDPQRSRIMKLARRKNKASFAKGAKKAAKTKKSKGTYRALGKFNSRRRKKNDSVEVIQSALNFLEGKEDTQVNEANLAQVEKAYDQLFKSFTVLFNFARKEKDPDLTAAVNKLEKALDTLAEEMSTILDPDMD